ncbi:MAG: L-threonylcarbamoyladenylate synthase [Aphanocapsa sp. GSE-SYN-MK-11-07L]|jgi:L-threonylcarbamoyladenylate synthase|nr:L-threonylcarbamoyladenylate synthase [Aphanocapsa sp. GSE-SYN-MK-11-07L]
MVQVTIAALVAGVRSGDWLISFPTDTVPALATRPDRAELIFAAKQRQPDKPLILMAATPEALWPYVQGSSQEREVWQQIAQHYWPGALTLVLPASDRWPTAINPLEATTIGLRVPNWAIAQAILQQTGPLATTSVNLSGQPPLENLTDIQAQFPQVYTPIADQWLLPSDRGGIPSTVIKWTGQGWEILRQGTVTL